jgi:hypothetical protein
VVSVVTGTGAELTGSAVAVVVTGSAGTGAAPAGSASAAVVGSGGVETVAAPAGSAVAAVAKGEAEIGAVLAGAARLETGAGALGESSWVKSEKSEIKPIPAAMKKRTIPNIASTASTTVRAHTPNVASIAPIRMPIHPIFLLVMTGSVLSLGFCALIITA